MAKEILCPKCNTLIKPSDEWDFIDGETEHIECLDCGHSFIVIIERPIEYFIPEN